MIDTLDFFLLAVDPDDPVLNFNRTETERNVDLFLTAADFHGIEHRHLVAPGLYGREGKAAFLCIESAVAQGLTFRSVNGIIRRQGFFTPPSEKQGSGSFVGIERGTDLQVSDEGTVP